MSPTVAHHQPFTVAMRPLLVVAPRPIAMQILHRASRFRGLKNLLLLVSFLVYGMQVVHAQGPAGAWQFGRGAGLRFSAAGVATAFSGAPATYNAAEGGSAIADAAGNLLFYTDGTQIYTRNHAIMPGSALLGGHISSSQSAVIVRQPGSTSRYFVFTTDAIESFPNAHKGLRYTVVDMALNAGMGGIPTGQKSILLKTNMTEKLTAVSHANGRDVWIAAHEMGNNSFVVYKLTEAGIDVAGPVLSAIGTPHSSPAAGNYNPGRGCMKFSPAGTHIALAILPNLNGRYMAELFDFDNQTGTVSNVRDLSIASGPDPGYAFYGLEFSATGGKLYFSSRKPPYQISQYNICSPTIAATRTVVGTTVLEPGTLQLGPNGKIYLAKSSDSKLGVIDNPEGLGTACNFRSDGLNLQGRSATFGLTNINQSILYRPGIDFEPKNLCQGAEHTFVASLSSCLARPAASAGFSWVLIAPGGSISRYSGASATIAFPAQGLYRLRLVFASGGVAIDSVSKPINIEPRPSLTITALDSGLCQGKHQYKLRTLPAGANIGILASIGVASSSIINSDTLLANTNANGQASVTIEATSIGGCKSAPVTKSWIVNQSLPPAPSGPKEACTGSQQSYTIAGGTANWAIETEGIASSAKSEFSHKFESEGSYTIAAGNYKGATAGTCFVGSSSLAVVVRAPKPLGILTWDSAFCPVRPNGSFSIQNTGDKAPIWTVVGGQIEGSDSAATIAVRWEVGAARSIQVVGQAVPNCPPSRFGSAIEERCLEFPNVVTANGDQTNETFEVKNLALYPENSIVVFNKWGKEVLAASPYSNAWPSGSSAAGTYFYQMKVRQGSSTKTYKGWVEVVK